MTTDASLSIDLTALEIDAEAWLEVPKEEFCADVVNKRLRQEMIRLLQKGFPHLSDDEADLAIVDAAIRCLSNGDYLRFDPRDFSLKGGFGLIALSCAEHLLRPFMVPAPTTRHPKRKIRVTFVGLPSEEGDYYVPAAFQVRDIAEVVMRYDWVEKGMS